MSKQKHSLIKEHHSLVDWDISLPWWLITTLEYISPPSSIYWTDQGVGDPIQLCRHASVLKVPTGQLVTYLRVSHASHYCDFLFRNTAALGVTDYSNSYRLEVRPTIATWRLEEYSAGGRIRYWDREKAVKAKNIWYKYRVSWWMAAWDMVVSLELLVDDVWVQQGDVVTVTDPLHGDSDIQRVGFWIHTYGSYKFYFDDTEVWEIT